jgi:tetratricopeptide (TPR) repeat protein
VDRELRSLGNQQKFLEEATTLQGELLKKLRDLRSLRDWVEIPYDLALKASDDGSVLIENSEFEKATSAFKEGIRQMVELENVGNVILEQKLDKVRMLIQELKLDEALFKIKEVLSKFPEHNEASQMIVEIEKMRPYMGLIEGAKSLMQNNKFLEAKKMYDDLLVEMPSLKIAVEGRREAYDKYLQFTVRPLIEEAKASFEAEKYSESLALLEKAKSLAPEDKSIETAIEQVKEALERNRIRDMLAQALSYYNNGNWNQAKELYGKVLEQDPENVEAKKGSLESSKRHAELVLFEDSMGLAQSYYREKRFPKALEHFNNAVSRMPDYMSLTSYQQRMKDDLERQRFPVKVRVLSDGKTWASILGVLPPEKFKEKTIELYPDVYQLRGKRAGYQDFSLEYPLERRDGDEVILVIECVK